MSNLPVHLVVEDVLSQTICERLLAFHSIEIGIVYGNEGFGYIKRRIRGFNHAAKGMRYFVLTDLDRYECAPGLWNRWLPGITKHPNLTFRVAVHEVESWLLGDAESLTRFLGLRSEIYFQSPDSLPNPKGELLALAMRSPKRMLREALVFQTREGALVQGPDYNGVLRSFVLDAWNISRAAKNSESLHGAIKSLRRLSSN